MLEHQVLGYDEVTRMLDEKLLLLNIARVGNIETVHFTSTSSIAATFGLDSYTRCRRSDREADWSQFIQLQYWWERVGESDVQHLPRFRAKSSPSGSRLPFQESNFEGLLCRKGEDRPGHASDGRGNRGEVQKPGGGFLRFIENDPRRVKEYEEFRQIAAHLQWLNDNRQLFVRPLVFDETLIADFKNTPSAGDINNGFNMGLRWRQKPNGNYELTRLKGGRVVVTNFDPMALTDQQRFELDEKIKKNPSGFVYLDIEAGRPAVGISLSRARSSYGACFRYSPLSPEVFMWPQSSPSV